MATCPQCRTRYPDTARACARDGTALLPDQFVAAQSMGVGAPGVFQNVAQHHQQGHPQQGYPQQGHPQQGHPQQGYPQQGRPQQGYPQQGGYGPPPQPYAQQQHAQQYAQNPQTHHPQHSYGAQGYAQQPQASAQPHRPPMESASNLGTIAPGTMIGDYRVEAQIGAGTFGTVYKAVHPVIGKRAAIKILNQEFCTDPNWVSRFVDEARAVNQIQSPNIIDIFTFGTTPSGQHYFAMELLEGSTFDKFLAEKGPVPPDVAIPILRKVSRALDAAHRAGIAHRDLKPENIFLAYDDDGAPQPKLLDFGIAKLVDSPTARARTQAGMPMGTPLYMSPEQCRGTNIDHRTDIYALGIITHQVLTGRLPFDGGAMELLLLHVRNPPPRMSESNPRLAPLDPIVLRMLEKEPNARQPSAGAAIDALAHAAQTAGLIGAAGSSGPAPAHSPALLSAATQLGQMPNPFMGGDQRASNPHIASAPTNYGPPGQAPGAYPPPPGPGMSGRGPVIPMVPSTMTAKRKAKTPLGLILGGVGFAVVALVVVIVLATRSSKDDKAETEETEEEAKPTKPAKSTEVAKSAETSATVAKPSADKPKLKPTEDPDPPLPADLSGVWTAKGTNPEGGNPYSGQTSFIGTGDSYHMTWANKMSGVGLKSGTILAASYNDTVALVGIYEVNKGSLRGKLMGANTGLEDQILNGPEGMNGTYQIVDLSSSVTGTVTLTPNGPVYQGKMVVGTARLDGTGFLAGKKLVMGWAKEGGSGAVFIYTKKGAGLDGKWTFIRSNLLGTELLQKGGGGGSP